MGKRRSRPRGARVTLASILEAPSPHGTPPVATIPIEPPQATDIEVATAFLTAPAYDIFKSDSAHVFRPLTTGRGPPERAYAGILLSSALPAVHRAVSKLNDAEFGGSFSTATTDELAAFVHRAYHRPVVDAAAVPVETARELAKPYRVVIKQDFKYFVTFTAYASTPASATALAQALSSAVAEAAGQRPRAFAVRPTYDDVFPGGPCGREVMCVAQENVRVWYGTPSTKKHLIAELRDFGCKGLVTRDFILFPTPGCLFASMDVYCRRRLTPEQRKIVADYVYRVNNGSQGAWSD